MNQSIFVQKITDSLVSDQSEMGGKAWSLSRLIKAGVDVPNAYCVKVSAYHKFLESSRLTGAGLNSESTQMKFASSKIPDDIEREIIASYRNLGNTMPVAIRSSARGEDSETKSFAGQFDTYLFVSGEEDVLAKVKNCWGSLWTKRADAYENHINDDSNTEAGIAVVIQEMIDSDCAGVLFTTDPLGKHKNSVIIDACWGLGEGVVSGQVVTDTFIADHQSHTIEQADIRSKRFYSGRDSEGNITLLETSDDQVDKPCLSPEQIKELTEKAMQLRLQYGCELDIEWVYKDQKLWFLQARPVTTNTQKNSEQKMLYADEDETSQHIKDHAFYSRMDTGEIVTGLMTPLGLSFCKFYQLNIHGPAVKTMGLLDIGDPHTYMGYLDGRVYLNISSSAMTLRQCPPTRDEMKFTKRYATQDIDFSNYKNPYGQGVSGTDYLKSSIYWIKTQIKNLMTAPGIVRKMVQLREQETRRFLRLDLKTMSREELNLELARIDRFFLESCSAYMPFFLQSFALYDALTEQCDKWIKGQGKGLQNRIKASMNNLRTIEVTRGIFNLVTSIRTSENLVSLFEQHSAEELMSILPKHECGRKFWTYDFSDFLFHFGSRGRQEFELSIPRWNDDPVYLLDIIKMYLKDDIKLEERLSQTEKLRKEDTRALLSQMPIGPRVGIKFLIRVYAQMAERRETTRPTFIAQTWFYRKILCEVLSRPELNHLVKPTDLPFIDFNKFRSYMSGDLSAEQAFSQELLNGNRLLHLKHKSSQEPPMAIIGAYHPSSFSSKPLPDSENGLKGIGASPGVIIARARVIEDLRSEAKNFKKGEILVTKFTDATWTPLFVLASGVVADIGSALSHSSIVSREFGIPAVVNVESGSQIIKTGDLIYINGDEGIVRIEEPAHSKKDPGHSLHQ